MKSDTARKIAKECAFYLLIVGLGVVWVIWLFRETEHSVSGDQVLGSVVLSSFVYGLICLGRLTVRVARIMYSKQEKLG